MAGTIARLAFKLLSTAIAIPVGKAIAKGTGKAWQKARPDDPPHNPREVQTDWRDALIWAGLTGLGAAIAQILSTKGADTAWRAMTGKASPRPKQPKSADSKTKDTKPEVAKSSMAKA